MLAWLLLAVCVAGVAAGVRLGGDGIGELTEAVSGWNAALVVLLVAILPLAGFSIAIAYVIVGIRFGPWAGGLIVAFATAVHLLASYGIGRTVLRGPIEAYLARRRHHLPHVPPGEDASVAAMAALVPGLPYFARHYLLALTDVPLRTWFLVCWPIYVARSYVELLLGSLGATPGRGALVTVGVVYVVKLAVCAYLLWRIRRRLQARTGAVRALDR